MREPEFFAGYRKRITALAVSVATLALAGACPQDENDDTAVLAATAAVLAQSSGSASSSAAVCGSKGFCLVFASAGNATVNAGIAGLDANCTNASNKPAGGGTYKAMVSDGTNRRACTTANCSGGTSEHIDWVFKPSTQYRRADATTIIGTTTANGVFTFPLTNSFQATITGTNSTVTGLNTNWTSNANDCTDWATNLGGTNMSFAVHDDATNASLSVGTMACNNIGKVVCVEQ